MLGAFLIFFREALEASMICSIMLAYLRQIGRRDRFKDVWIGVAAACFVALVGGVVVFQTLRNYDGSALQTRIESVTYFIACGVLTYMTLWMNRQGKNMKQHLNARMEDAVTAGSTWAIAGIAFLTVGREGLETVVFMIAIAFHTGAVGLSLGALVGIMFGLGLSYLIYIAGRRINLKKFFDVMGTLLMLFAAGLLADGIEGFQQLHWLPTQVPLWNTTGWLSESSTLGDILHSFFGYAAEPSVLQVSAYMIYIAFVLRFFWHRPAPVRRTSKPAQ